MGNIDKKNITLCFALNSNRNASTLTLQWAFFRPSLNIKHLYQMLWNSCSCSLSVRLHGSSKTLCCATFLYLVAMRMLRPHQSHGKESCCPPAGKINRMPLQGCWNCCTSNHDHININTVSWHWHWRSQYDCRLNHTFHIFISMESHLTPHFVCAHVLIGHYDAWWEFSLLHLSYDSYISVYSHGVWIFAKFNAP